MLREEIQKKLSETIIPRINILGYEAVEISVAQASGRATLRFLVDRPSGGISLKECQVLNNEISSILDMEDIIETGYILEVSSPGVDRPLATKKDFLRVIGRRLKVFLHKPVRKKLEVEGRLERVEGESAFLDLGDKIEEITLDKIHKAKQVIE